MSEPRRNKKHHPTLSTNCSASPNGNCISCAFQRTSISNHTGHLTPASDYSTSTYYFVAKAKRPTTPEKQKRRMVCETVHPRTSPINTFSMLKGLMVDHRATVYEGAITSNDFTFSLMTEGLQLSSRAL